MKLVFLSIWLPTNPNCNLLPWTKLMNIEAKESDEHLSLICLLPLSPTLLSSESMFSLLRLLVPMQQYWSHCFWSLFQVTTAAELWPSQHHPYTYKQCFYILPLDLVPAFTPCMLSFGDEVLLRVVCLSSLVSDTSTWLSKDQDALSISRLSHAWRMLPPENYLLSWAPLPVRIAFPGIPPLNKLKCACLKHQVCILPLFFL